MAWIESHQSLARHPKTKRLARALGVTVPTAIGHLHLLWWWALDYAQSGDITKYTPEDIADAVAWEGDPVQFVDALVYAGFVDRDGERVELHDWDDYAGKLLERRASDRERKRKSSRPPAEFRRNSDGTRTDSVVTIPTQPTEPEEVVVEPAREEAVEPDADDRLTAWREIRQGWEQAAGARAMSSNVLQLFSRALDDGFEPALLAELARRAGSPETRASAAWLRQVLADLARRDIRTRNAYLADEARPRAAPEDKAKTVFINGFI